MGDASPNAETPRGTAATDEELTQFAFSRLVALAEYIDLTTGSKSVLDGRAGRIRKALETAIFRDRPPPTSDLEFYPRAAAAIRDWLVARLEALMSNQATIRTDPSIGLRLKKWCEFHRNAAALPVPLRDVHDLMYYFRLPTEKTAAILGRRIIAVELDRDAAVSLLRPLFDKARGKE